jgi:hypothetical protein
MTVHPQRQKLEQLMRGTLADSSHWDYRAVRPLFVYPKWERGQHINADCSFGCKLLCRWARILDDPTGGHYDGFGNSTSIAVHLRHLASAGACQVGDIVCSGSDGHSSHAAMVLEPGSDPLMWSHGHEGAPNAYRLSQDSRRKTFCRLNVGTFKLTPVQKLRMQSGYWAWLCWTLGEGDWKKYPPMADKVRPDVPVPISKTWWNRREKFMQARSEANPRRFKG